MSSLFNQKKYKGKKKKLDTSLFQGIDEPTKVNSSATKSIPATVALQMQRDGQARKK